MNKVAERCQRDSSANFYYASKRLYFETKAVKVFLYLAAVVPIVLTFLPVFKENETAGLILSLISFCVTLISEVSSAFMNEHKESAILELQMYESEITGSTFSKIEYDREATNEVYELAIRKGLPKLKRKNVHPVEYVPEEITDDYSYIYLCRVRAAKERYLLSRIFYIYFFMLAAIVITFIFSSVFVKDGSDPATYLTLIIGFYPLVMPIIKDCLACKKAMKKCAKLCADIDNFFADGDDSIGRLARFYYYVQNLEFEMFTDRPAVFNIFPWIFKKQMNILQEGVTYRFLDAIKELKSRSLMLKGTLKQPKGKSIITKVEYDDEYLSKLAKEKKAIVVNKAKPGKKTIQKEVEEPVIEDTMVENTMVEEIPEVEAPKTVKKTTTKKVTAPKTEVTDKPVVKKTSTTKTSQSTKSTTSKPKTTKK